MAEAAESLDYVLDTVPVEHDLNPYIETLGLDGIYIRVGQLTPLQPPVQAGSLIRRRRVVTGSLIGGMPETQEVLDFCADNGVRCDIEMIAMEQINEAYARLKRSDVGYRFVIDMSSL